MIFPYRPIVVLAPDGIDYLLVLRPEIPIVVSGPAGEFTYLGLVDTGSDQTILPSTIAKDLGIDLQLSAKPSASAFGGQQVNLHAGRISLRLESDGESCAWSDTVSFFDFPSRADEAIVLGHAGFLDYFTATFDGKLGQLTLLPNDELPPP
jgi:hypothetical protein